jgi:hypothetical protein
MVTAVPRGRKRRRSITEVVTIEAINAESESLYSRLHAAERRQPPPADQAEEDERTRLLQQGLMVAGLAALVYLREHKPAIHVQVASSVVRFTEDRLRKRRATFEIRPLAKDERFWSRVNIQYVLAGHRIFLPRLKEIWRERPLVPADGKVRRSVALQLYGDRRYQGAHHRARLIAHRAKAVCALLAEMGIDKVEEGRRVTEQIAGRWVRMVKTPANVSHRILARLFGVSVRRVEQILALAPRQDAEARQVLDAIDARDSSENEAQFGRGRRPGQAR